MQKNADATGIATVLVDYHSTKRKKENIKKLYKFVNESKDRPNTKQLD